MFAWTSVVPLLSIALVGIGAAMPVGALLAGLLAGVVDHRCADAGAQVGQQAGDMREHAELRRR